MPIVPLYTVTLYMSVSFDVIVTPILPFASITGSPISEIYL